MDESRCLVSCIVNVCAIRVGVGRHTNVRTQTLFWPNPGDGTEERCVSVWTVRCVQADAFLPLFLVSRMGCVPILWVGPKPVYDNYTVFKGPVTLLRIVLAYASV